MIPSEVHKYLLLLQILSLIILSLSFDFKQVSDASPREVVAIQNP